MKEKRHITFYTAYHIPGIGQNALGILTSLTELEHNLFQHQLSNFNNQVADIEITGYRWD